MHRAAFLVYASVYAFYRTQLGASDAARHTALFIVSLFGLLGIAGAMLLAATMLRLERLLDIGMPALLFGIGAAVFGWLYVSTFRRHDEHRLDRMLDRESAAERSARRRATCVFFVSSVGLFAWGLFVIWGQAAQTSST